MQRLVKVDHKVRTDSHYPAGLMDVIQIEKTNENFRLLYDVKGRFVVHRITPEEADYKLCKVHKYQIGAKGVPFIVTHDGRTIRYPDPLIRANDTIRYNLKTGKIEDFTKFEVGNLCMITGGRNMGRIGIITTRERHLGGFDVVHVKDSLAILLLLVCLTFLLLARAIRIGFLCQETRELSCPFLRKETSVLV